MPRRPLLVALAVGVVLVGVAGCTNAVGPVIPCGDVLVGCDGGKEGTGLLPPAPTAPPGSNVTVDPDSVAIAVGETVKLFASVTDSAGTRWGTVIFWESRDTLVATVSAPGPVAVGEVTGTAGGKTWVVASTWYAQPDSAIVIVR